MTMPEADLPGPGRGQVVEGGAEVKRVKPADRVFAFEEAKGAYLHMKSTVHFGTIMIGIFAA
jgi:NADPH:quinone reductase-like Zn-dependent oxidoreductase